MFGELFYQVWGNKILENENESNNVSTKREIQTTLNGNGSICYITGRFESGQSETIPTATGVSEIGPGPAHETEQDPKSSISDFTTNGIFGPEGLLASLESFSLKPLTDEHDNSNLGNYFDTTEQESIAESTDSNNTNIISTVNALSFYSPEDAVFSIDLIMDLIFSNLEEINPSTLHHTREDFLNCRLVSKRWSHFATKKLKKITTIQFTQKWRELQLELDSEPVSTPLHDLKDLTSLMDNSDHFPCTSFIFSYANFVDPTAQHFFNAHGSHVTNLVLIDGLGRSPIFVDDVKRLLVSQTPNLKHLEIMGNVCFKIRTKTRSNSSHDDEIKESKELELSPPELLESDPDPSPVSTFTGSEFKSSLKFLKLGSKISYNTFEQILLASPNLSEIELHDKNLPLLLQPVNRLHLLKSLTIIVTKYNIDALEALADRDRNQGNWALQELKMYSLQHSKQHLWERATVVMSKILQGCSGSLEKLVWFPNRFLKGIQIPRMSKVRDLTLIYYDMRIVQNPAETQFFPGSVSIANMFPNLERVTIRDMLDLNIVPIPMTALFDNLEPVQCVKFVSSILSQNVEVLEGLQKLFPNATFEAHAPTRYECTERMMLTTV